MKRKIIIKNPVAKDLMTPKYSSKKIEDKRKKNPKHKKNYKAMDEAREYTDEERYKDLEARHHMHKEKAQVFHGAFKKAMKRGGVSKTELHRLINSRETHHQLALETGQKLKELGARMKKNDVSEALVKSGRKRITMKSPTGYISHVNPNRATQLAKMGFVPVSEGRSSVRNKEISDLIEMKLSELAEKTKRIFGDELFEQIDFFEFLEILQEELQARKKDRPSKEEDDEEDEDKENDLKPHVIMQARKAMDMKSDPEEMINIKFHDGDTKKVAVKDLRRANAMYNLLRPNQKEDLGSKLNAGHDSFMKAIGAVRG